MPKNVFLQHTKKSIKMWMTSVTLELKATTRIWRETNLQFIHSWVFSKVWFWEHTKKRNAKKCVLITHQKKYQNVDSKCYSRT